MCLGDMHTICDTCYNSAQIIEPWEFHADQSYKSASTVSHVKQSKENESMGLLLPQNGSCYNKETGDYW